ncbi:ComEC/Rec2 family competence protein [Kordiimonas pumila]|uniref:ComEC/Rec2 family competence protein n=1 Tax=Kordiimonas pumila TaxID=2161677 RepID=A0ABV7D2X3_9PROT|nr:ComEC/Rec2 family competence protein [Kordiimonas pumila]
MAENYVRNNHYQTLWLHSEWRLLVWSVSFAVGILLFLHWLPLNPILHVLIGAFFILIGLTVCILNKKYRYNMLFLVFLAFCLGSTLASKRIIELQEPYVKTERYVHIDGFIETSELNPDGSTTLFVNPQRIGDETVNIPDRIRLISRVHNASELISGAHITLYAVIDKPKGPLVPDGYNFAKSAYFEGVGASGYVVSYESIKYNKNNTLISKVNVLRKDIETNILQTVTGQEGAVATALVVGNRSHISADTTEAMRLSGLSHLLAISGLHMGLVTGIVFFVFEFIFALIPAIGLRVLPKKLAVMPAWVAGLLYLFVSGNSVSATRAFIMVSVALLAVLTDRKVLSLRSVALAAIIMLFFWPESILTIGFQMSFAATSGLIAFYEVWAKRISVTSSNNIIHKIAKYSVATACTCIVAQLSVAPFALYHFQSLSMIGVVSNILVFPLISFLVMPLLVIGLVISPFGGYVFVGMLIEKSLGFVLWIAHSLASCEFSALYTNPLETWAFFVAVAAFIAVLLIRKVHVVLCLICIFCFALWFGQKPVAHILISETGKSIAEIRDDQIYAYGTRTGSFRHRIWNGYWAKPSTTNWNRLERLCDVDACRYATHVPVTYAKTIDGVRSACSVGDIVIIAQKYRRYCRDARLVITQEDLDDHGPAALYLSGPVKIEWSNK